MNMKMLLVVTSLVPFGAVLAQDEEQPPQPVFEATQCADLTATPTRLPNGDDQYPVIPCKPVDYMTPPPPAEPEEQAVPKPQPKAPVTLEELEQGTVPQAAAEEQMDYNNLQMRRLGDMDARQGKPINMNYGGNLYYLQGYTQGQKERLKAPGANGFGGVQGFGR